MRQVRKQGRGKGGEEPGGGEPASRRRGDPEPGSSPGATPPGARRRSRKHPGPGRTPGSRYAPEERRRLLEAYARSGMGIIQFSKTVGVSPQTLSTWKGRYEAEGPKGLEPKGLGRPKGSGAGSTLPSPVKEAIAATKRRFPTFGLRKVKDYLARFLGLKVSEGGVAKVIRETPDLPAPAAPRRRVKRHAIVRTFERSRPGELWQSDITSFLLKRHHRRVYLTVFLDDYSRFIVAWKLESQATSELVTGCVLDGIQKYGKPVEVLTDQGPQYSSWRGKSRLRKLLEKEGIRHVVARSHHPQTVGKCERLWKTIAAEFWDRAHPEELEEARERLSHWVSFYNFFRPHQSLKGMTPGDRFFGHEEAVARAVAGRITENALRLAVGEKPRKTLFVVGQVGDRAFSMHGEQGRVVLQTEAGIHEALGLEELGLTKAKEAGHEEGDGGGAGEDGNDGDGAAPGEPDGGGGACGGGGGEDEGPAADAEAAAEADGAAGGGGAGAVGGGDGGGEAAGARGGDGDPRVVARGAAEGGGAGAPPGDAASPLADEPDGGLGDGGGAPEAAEEAGEGGAGDAGGGEPGGAEEEGGAPREGSACGAGAGRADADTSLLADDAGGPSAREEGWAHAPGSGRGSGSR